MYCWQTAWASSTWVHVWAAAQIARAPTVVGCKSQGVAINKCCLRVTSPDASLWNPVKQSHRGEEFCSQNSTFKALLSAWSELARCQPASRKKKFASKTSSRWWNRKKEQMREKTLFASKQKSDAVAYYDDLMITLCCKVWDINTYNTYLQLVS